MYLDALGDEMICACDIGVKKLLSQKYNSIESEVGSHLHFKKISSKILVHLMTCRIDNLMIHICESTYCGRTYFTC